MCAFPCSGLWLEPEKHGLRTNEVGFPVGVPLRALSRRMAQLGLCNGKGKEYHPYQLQEMIFEGFPVAAAVVLNVELTPETVAAADCVMVVTDHSDVDYRMVRRAAKVVVDTRNAMPKED